MKAPSFGGTQAHEKSGATRRDVLIVLAAVFLMGLIFLASTRQRRDPNTRVNCIGNLKQIALASQLWAGDHGDKFPMQVPESQGGSLEGARAGHVAPTFLLMSNELQSPKILVCVDDKDRYPLPKFFEELTERKISYFIALDAEYPAPGSVLAGDRNIEVVGSREPVPGLLTFTNSVYLRWTHLLHGGEGNVAYADGSVQQATTRDLQKIFALGLRTNRLVVP